MRKWVLTHFSIVKGLLFVMIRSLSFSIYGSYVSNSYFFFKIIKIVNRCRHIFSKVEGLSQRLIFFKKGTNRVILFFFVFLFKCRVRMESGFRYPTSDSIGPTRPSKVSRPHHRGGVHDVKYRPLISGLRPS